MIPSAEVPAGAGVPAPAAGVCAGFYGKLPTVGDFVVRDLSPEFVAPWDAWLQRALADSQLRLGADFDELYLTFPIWRFVAGPGAFGPDACWGVLLPSVDRVGRRFPLTLAQPLSLATLHAVGMAGAEAQLQAFATLGLEALDDLPLDRLQAALSSLPAAHELAAAAASGSAAPAATIDLSAFAAPGGTGHWPLAGALDAALLAAAERMLWAALADRMLWWLAPADDRAGTLRLAALPLVDGLLADLIVSN